MSKATPGRISISLSLLGIAGLMVGLASASSLVVVVSIKNVDALSTLAMALAVLAFVVQLMVFIVQSAEAARQAQQGQVLHGQLLSLLATIQERTQGTQQSVDRMNTRLLEAVIGKATSEGLEVGSPEFNERVASGLASAQQPPSAPSPQRSDMWPPPLDPEVAHRLHRQMRQWPSPEDAEEVKEIVHSLDEWATGDVLRLADDLVRMTAPGTGLGPGLTLFEDDEIVTRGLAAKIPGWKLYSLTEKGRNVGRIFTAEGEPPDAYVDLLPVRETAIERAAALRAGARDQRDPDDGASDRHPLT